MERRIEDRTETNVHLTCRVPARPCRATMQDLSHTGCRLEFRDAILELGGTALIDLPGGSQVAGRIVWIRGNLAGIQFHRRLGRAVSIALGLDEPESEPEPVATTEPDAALSGGGILRHWFRKLTSRLS
jgi:hypothetical protein